MQTVSFNGSSAISVFTQLELTRFPGFRLLGKVPRAIVATSDSTSQPSIHTDDSKRRQAGCALAYDVLVACSAAVQAHPCHMHASTQAIMQHGYVTVLVSVSTEILTEGCSSSSNPMRLLKICFRWCSSEVAGTPHALWYVWMKEAINMSVPVQAYHTPHRHIMGLRSCLANCLRWKGSCLHLTHSLM